jgi:hypothetical protein
MTPPLEGALESAVCEVDPLDPVATIRERLLVLDHDLTARCAHRSFGGVFTVTAKDTHREKEGRQ